MESYYGAQDEIHVVTKKKDDTEHGKEETYYESHTDINETVEGRKETKKRTLIVENESLEDTKQCKPNHSNKIEKIILVK